MRIFIHTFFFVVCYIVVAFFQGCSESISNPGYGAIDTTGNGGNPNSLWLLEGPVTYSDGVIRAVISSDQAADSTFARCTLKEAVDFGEAAGVIFTWGELIEGDAKYQFFVGGDTARMMSLNHVETPDGLQLALIVFQGSFTEPLYSRFEFRLPASSSVQIQNYTAEGE